MHGAALPGRSGEHLPGGGGAVWGPGGWAGTTGNVYRRWGSTQAVTRTSGGYNAWTGTGWRNQVGTAYNYRTGTIAAGQRAAMGNVYTGNYAYGTRGVAGNREAGIVAGGSKVTAGNAYGGRELTAGRGAVYNRNTGQTTRVGGVTGEQGSVGRVGDKVYGTKDGQVYRRSGQGSWEQAGKGGSWEGVQSSGRKSSWGVSTEPARPVRSEPSPSNAAECRQVHTPEAPSRGAVEHEEAEVAAGRYYLHRTGLCEISFPRIGAES